MKAHFETQKDALGAKLRIVPQTVAERAALNLFYYMLKDQVLEDVASLAGDDSFLLQAIDGQLT